MNQSPGKFFCKKCGAFESVRKYLDESAECFECGYLYFIGEYDRDFPTVQKPRSYKYSIKELREYFNYDEEEGALYHRHTNLRVKKKREIWRYHNQDVPFGYSVKSRKRGSSKIEDLICIPKI